MFVSVMAFHAKISDPIIGGTYMTLLNTISNMAGTWVGTLALWLVDNVSIKDCEGATDESLDCDTMQELQVAVTILSGRGNMTCIYFQGFIQGFWLGGKLTCAHRNIGFGNMVWDIPTKKFWRNLASLLISVQF